MLAELSAKEKAGNSNPNAILVKLAINVMMQLGVRGGSELHSLRVTDLVPKGKRDSDHLPERIELSENVTTTRRGQNKGEAVRQFNPAMFRNDEHPEHCPVR